jgi:hypothetical protein
VTKKKKPQKRKLVIFNTPERECAHADRGCCPKCLDPMGHTGTAFGKTKLTQRY